MCMCLYVYAYKHMLCYVQKFQHWTDCSTYIYISRYTLLCDHRQQHTTMIIIYCLLLCFTENQFLAFHFYKSGYLVLYILLLKFCFIVYKIRRQNLKKKLYYSVF